MAIRVVCDQCKTKFPWDFSKGWPEACVACGTPFNQGDDEVAAPHIGKTIGKSADAVYRAMEVTSETRMEQAAEMSGGDKSDFAGLKITNLRDNMREGDIAAIAPDATSVTPGMAGGFAGGDALGYSGAVAIGPNPNAGLRALNGLRSTHAASNPGTVVDRPALETLNPGYRRRV